MSFLSKIFNKGPKPIIAHSKDGNLATLKAQRAGPASPGAVKKPDTFSQHYCDYTNPYVQLIMSRKLDRWLVCYDSRKQADYQRSTAAGTIKGIGDGVPYAEIEVVRGVTASGDAINEPITIRVESTHGFMIAISSYEQREFPCVDP